ncbi:hypothetical protein [Photobacterium sp.]|uniref:hypothetical protein n=1 Tax=Photobacterium sp. TaxID=660 RepID=UPI00299D87BE|nr:hypothetical protein [Photobacterium sp.]MDX1301758.1 hypothetical protein [Photobacterium sp.]
MAAEKLTKARLIQIIFLMTVLMAAFVWRTITYNDSKPADDKATQCQVKAGTCVFEEEQQELEIILSPSPAVAESPLIVQIGNVNVKPTATVEGIDMFMGTIPVIFEQKGDVWLGHFSVPACVHPKMDWRMNLEQGGKKVIVKFTVIK